MIVMKNKYIAPAIVEYEILVQDIVATSPASSTTLNVGDDVETAITDAGCSARHSIKIRTITFAAAFLIDP